MRDGAVVMDGERPLLQVPSDVLLERLLNSLAVPFYWNRVGDKDQAGRPFRIAALRPIQMSNPRVLDALAEGRRAFTTGEWRDFLIRSIGLEPAALDERAKRVVLLRMVPFVERNYNLVELGPRGTGKSHIYQQISPNAHLLSGGKATVAKMFVNMANGQRGLVCWTKVNIEFYRDAADAVFQALDE